jgi:hypothetical protein
LILTSSGSIMLNIKLSVLLLFLLIFTGETSALDSIACGPKPGYFSPYWFSTAVFTGVVDSLERSEKEMIAKLTVEKAYRGIDSENVEIVTEVRHGYPFVQGQRYFVYAWPAKEGRLYVDMCSPTKGLTDAAEDIEFAEDVAAGKRGTRIHGYVFVYRPKLRTLREHQPTAGLKVTIRDQDGRELTTTTDEKGRYIFKEVADGTYEIKSETPPGTHLVKGSGPYIHDDKVYIGWETCASAICRTPRSGRKGQFRVKFFPLRMGRQTNGRIRL